MVAGNSVNMVADNSAYQLKLIRKLMSSSQMDPDDVANGYVWLDYASVPQAADAEEARLRLQHTNV